MQLIDENEDNEKKLEKALETHYKKVESDLQVVGATAIEDALQDECRETISIVREAGINLWVLTGDKIETALNIGYSVNIIDKSMKLYRHRLPTKKGIEEKFTKHEQIYLENQN